MQTADNRPQDPCIVAGVQPLLTELHDAVDIRLHGPGDADRDPLEQFIQQTFRQAFGADIHSFYPQLAAFSCHGRLRAVAGYRSGANLSLFSEQYLDEPVETLMARHLDHSVERCRVVEVGNLALAGSGDARWVIAAMTLLLRAAGYRWVLFTAVKTVFNTFQRLGLRPVAIAIPDPARLTDTGDRWGSYYAADPRVYVGDIQSGYLKLSSHIAPGQHRLHALLQAAQHLGRHTFPVSGCTQRRIG